MIRAYRLVMVSLLLVTAIPNGAHAQKTHSSFATSYGVTLRGAELGIVPGTFGRDYVYPSGHDADYLAAHGLYSVRLPIRWERLQPALGQPLDMVELSRLLLVLGQATRSKVEVIITLSNQGRYNDAPLGSAGLPVEALGDFWKALAQFTKKMGRISYDLMDQPNGFSDAKVWPSAAQRAVNAIREVDTTHSIYVQGDHASNAATWAGDNPTLRIEDSSHNLIYGARVNFDADGSGLYAASYEDEHAHPKIGIERLEPFVKWLQRNHYRGTVSDYTVPDTDPRWLDILDKTLSYLGTNCVSGTYGAALAPVAGVDRLQLAVLAKHPGVANCSTNPTLPVTVPEIVHIKSTSAGNLLAANGGGGAVTLSQASGGDWSSFGVNDITGTDFNSGDLINLSAHNRQFFSVECGGGSGGLDCGSVNANRNLASDWEQFKITKVKGSAGDEILSGDLVTLQSFGGYYCSADPDSGGDGTKLFCDQQKARDGETFTISW